MKEKKNQGSIQANVSITLIREVENKDTNEKFERYYKFDMPVGAPFEEALAFAKEMVAQVEIMKKKSEEAKEKDKSDKKEEEDKNKNK